MALVTARASIPRTTSVLEQAQRGLKRGLDRSAAETRGRLRVKVASWKHKPDFQIDASSITTRVVSTDNEIFLFQDGGTKPHIIRPKVRQYLRFKPRTNGAFIFAKQVHHPGIPAAKWTTTIARQMERRMPTIFAEALKEQR